ncbi:MAG: DNA-binding response regulator [Bacteroidetes bacterium]|nr:MAG: DNA-binding response regulator [Bacteroidota bacterium]
MKAVIVDDEPLARDILQTYLEKVEEATLVGVCSNALEAFALLNKEKVDLLLLDINMPEINGMDFLKTLKSPPLVIFTTAYHEYAVASYELNAVDYLLKPIPFERFLKAIYKAKQLLQETENISVNPSAASAQDRLMFVRTEGKWVKVDLTKLWLVEGLKDYVRLWFDDVRLTVHSTMKNFEDQLKPYPNFIRVHKSHIVNLEFVAEIDNQCIKVKGQLIAIGSTYKDEVWKVLQEKRLV